MTVRRRIVWYFHGFDPATGARYRRIFEAASRRLGVQITELPDGGEGWRAVRGGTVTDIRLLRYEDLVRAWRAPGLAGRLWRGGRALGGLCRTGAMGRLARTAPRTAALAISPFVVLVAPVVLALPVFMAGLWVGLAAMVVALILGCRLVRRGYLDVVADLFAWMHAMARGRRPTAAYEARIKALAAGIATGEGADEVLVVGHSLGGIAAVRAVAEVLGQGDGSPAPGKLGLLTLGSTHGVVLADHGPGRDRLARAVARIAGAIGAGRVFWLDVSAPRDAFCVPLTDPLLMIGGAARPGLASPRIISARLAHAPAIPGDRRTVLRAMRRHMGYLLVPEAGSGFDYAETVTGPISLEERFGARGNSPRARMWQS